MAAPKSATLLAQEKSQMRQVQVPAATPVIDAAVFEDGKAIQIKPIQCCNEFVAIMPFRFKSSLALLEISTYKNEGIVVGIGPGAPGLDGKRCPSQLVVGDVVIFSNQQMAMKPMVPKSGVYADKQIIVISERAVICKKQPVLFELVSDEKSATLD